MPNARSRAISEPFQSTNAAAAPGHRSRVAAAKASRIRDSVAVPSATMRSAVRSRMFERFMVLLLLVSITSDCAADV